MCKSDTFAPADSLNGTAAFVLPGDQILPSLLPMACYPAWSYSFEGYNGYHTLGQKLLILVLGHGKPRG